MRRLTIDKLFFHSFSFFLLQYLLLPRRISFSSKHSIAWLCDFSAYHRTRFRHDTHTHAGEEKIPKSNHASFKSNTYWRIVLLVPSVARAAGSIFTQHVDFSSAPSNDNRPAIIVSTMTIKWPRRVINATRRANQAEAVSRPSHVENMYFPYLLAKRYRNVSMTNTARHSYHARHVADVSACQKCSSPSTPPCPRINFLSTRSMKLGIIKQFAGEHQSAKNVRFETRGAIYIKYN